MQNKKKKLRGGVRYYLYFSFFILFSLYFFLLFVVFIIIYFGGWGEGRGRRRRPAQKTKKKKVWGWKGRKNKYNNIFLGRGLFVVAEWLLIWFIGIGLSFGRIPSAI